MANHRTADGHSREKATGQPSRTYVAWVNMKSRCYDKNDNVYERYGGRGISVCVRWRNNFLAFLEDMGKKPVGLTLERKNVNGNYTPRNCVWATPMQQAHNRRVQRNNTSSVPGAYWVESKQRWVLRMHIDGARKYIGSSPTLAGVRKLRKQTEQSNWR